jgi:phenylacetate-CoA ligase
MARITGRSDDMLIIRGVNVFPSQIEELIGRIPQLVPHYQILVDKDGHLDAMTIRVELDGGLSPSDEVRVSAARELQHHVKSYVGVSAQVEVTAPFEIERVVVGKARRVIDRRPKE